MAPDQYDIILCRDTTASGNPLKGQITGKIEFTRKTDETGYCNLRCEADPVTTQQADISTADVQHQIATDLFGSPRTKQLFRTDHQTGSSGRNDRSGPHHSL